MLRDLPIHTPRAIQFLREQLHDSWPANGANEFEVIGVHIASAEEFSLDLTHPADSDGVYTVRFKKGDPVAWVTTH